MAETETLAAFVAGTDLDAVPEAAREHARRAIRDYLGVALFGSTHAVGDRMTRYVEQFEPGDAATVLARGTASPTGAALANGAFGHAVDYDDTFESIVIHPTSPVFPAALAAAEHADGSGRDVLEASVLGTEVASRVGHATYPAHYDQGFHATGTIGAFGAAAAAGRVLGLDADGLRHAFGVAASSSSSLKKNFGSMTKPYHAGHAAQAGLRAALLADDGFTADPAILEGPIGYGATMTPDGSYDPAEISEGLGESWAVEDVGFKPYPSGVITHAAMEAMRRLVVEHDLEPADVERVVATLDDAASEMLHHRRPENALQAKFSIEFCLAAVLRERDVGIHEFSDEYVAEPATRDAVALVERAFEPNLFGGAFAGYGARVVVETADGERLVEEERRAPGAPSNPLAESRWRAKYDECARAALDADAADAAAAAVASLGESGSLAALLEAVRR